MKPSVVDFQGDVVLQAMRDPDGFHGGSVATADMLVGKLQEVEGSCWDGSPVPVCKFCGMSLHKATCHVEYAASSLRYELWRRGVEPVRQVS